MSIFSSIGSAVKGVTKAAIKYNPLVISTRATLGAAKAIPGVKTVVNPISRVFDAATLNKSTAPKTTTAANRTSFTVRPNTLPGSTASAAPPPAADSSGFATDAATAKATGASYRAPTVGARNTTQMATDPTVLAQRQEAARGSGGKGDPSLFDKVASALNPSNPVVPSTDVQKQSFAADGGASSGYGGGADVLYNALDAAAQTPGASAYAPAQRYNDPYGGAQPFAYGGVAAGGGYGGGGGGGGGGGYAGGGGGYAFDAGPVDDAPAYGPSSDQVDVSYSDDGVAIPDHMYDSQASEQGDDEGDATLYFEGLSGIGDDLKSGLKSFGGDVAREGAQRLAEGAASKLQAKGKSTPKKEYAVVDKPMSSAKKVVIGAAVAAPLLIAGSHLLHHGHRGRR